MPDFTTRFSAWLSDVPVLQSLIALLLLLVVVQFLAARSRAREAERIGAESEQLRRELVERKEFAHAIELRSGRQETQLEAALARQGELTEEKDGLADALHAARQRIAGLQTELAENRLSSAKDREAASREIENLRALREEMTDQFKLLANETLQVQRRDMQVAQGDHLTALLAPFRDQVNRFQTELQTRNKVLDEESAKLRQHIATLHARSEAISQEAVNLTRALKGEKQRQGAWGEMILERILEESGLDNGIHYETQFSWRDETGRVWRPDVIVRMPRKKVMVIDSKVSLNDYEISVNAEDRDKANAALSRHVAALRAHITGLGDKGYHRMDDNSVDYVLMFIPVEGAFSEALRADPSLASFALERGVGLTTPTTLMLTLRTVEHIWAVDRRESNAAEIARRAGALYDKVAGFLDSMDGVGRALDQANRAHIQAMDRLSRGNGNVIRQVEMLRELGARTQKQIATDHDRDDKVQSLPAQEHRREDTGT